MTPIKRSRFALLTLYFIFVMVILIIIPTLGFVGPYSFPTSVMALNVIKYGKVYLPSQMHANVFWTHALSVERDYPIPALLLVVLQLVTDIPKHLLPFLPISGFITFIFYYVTMLKVLLQKTEKDIMSSDKIEICLILLIIIFVLFNNIHAYYIGRATFGVALFTMAIFSILKLFISNKKDSWFTLLFIVSITLSLTYYTSTLAIFFIFFLLLINAIFVHVVKPSLFNRNVRKYILGLTILSLLLVSYQPIMKTISLSSDRFINNIVEWLRAQLRIERESKAYYLNVGEVSMDIFTRITFVWLGRVLKLTFIMSFVYYFLHEVLRVLEEKNLKMEEPANILAVMAIGAALSELFYTFQAPVIALRFLLMISIFYVPLAIVRIKRMKTKTLLSLIISILLIVNYVGTLYYVSSYGWVGKIGGPWMLQGFMLFASATTCLRHNNIIAGDSYYTGYAYFIAELRGFESNLLFTTLGKHTFCLFRSNSYYVAEHCIRKLISQGIDYLMLVNDGKPIAGDPWGYVTTPSHNSMEFLIRHSNVLYNDLLVYLVGFY